MSHGILSPEEIAAIDALNERVDVRRMRVGDLDLFKQVKNVEEKLAGVEESTDFEIQQEWVVVKNLPARVLELDGLVLGFIILRPQGNGVWSVEYHANESMVWSQEVALIASVDLLKLYRGHKLAVMIPQRENYIGWENAIRAFGFKREGVLRKTAWNGKEEKLEDVNAWGFVVEEDTVLPVDMGMSTPYADRDNDLPF